MRGEIFSIQDLAILMLLLTTPVRCTNIGARDLSQSLFKIIINKSF